MIRAREQTERAPADLGELVEQVAPRTGKPLDPWAVAAALESEGVRDLDAVQRFRRRDVFDLANTLYPLVLSARGDRPTADVPATSPSGRALRRAYLRGAFFFVPLAIQVVSLAILGYSQWASLHFSLRQASAIALAVGASFIVTAGCSQVIGYLGPYFDAPGKHRLTERVSYGALLAGLVLAAVIGLVLWLLLAATDAYPGNLARVSLVYYVLLSALWLVTALLYMVRAYAAMVLATILGLLAVAAMRGGAHTSLYVAQWVGLSVSVLAALGVAAVRLRRRAEATTGERRLARLPRASLLGRRALPFFIYGMLYFSFLFVDRLVGWSAGVHPLPIWFRIPYEVGLDWALVSIVLGMAFLEVLVIGLPALTDALQERTAALDVTQHNRAVGRFHTRGLLITAGLLAVGSAGAYFGVRGLAHVGALHGLRSQLSNPVTLSVYAWGLGGYALLCVGLVNAVFLFSLARPWSAVRALLPALAVDVAVGLILSRTGPYWHSVIGLTAGALVFAVASGVAARRAAHQADYSYFASF